MRYGESSQKYCCFHDIGKCSVMGKFQDTTTAVMVATVLRVSFGGGSRASSLWSLRAQLASADFILCLF